MGVVAEKQHSYLKTIARQDLGDNNWKVPASNYIGQQLRISYKDACTIVTLFLLCVG
jgi:hypothetical protein